MFPPEALKENLPLPLPACGGCWHSLGYGHISLLHFHIPFSVHQISLCLSHKDTLRCNLGSRIIVSEGPKHNYICKTFFPNQVTFTGSGDCVTNIPFFGDDPWPTIVCPLSPTPKFRFVPYARYFYSISIFSPSLNPLQHHLSSKFHPNVISLKVPHSII